MLRRLGPAVATESGASGDAACRHPAARSAHGGALCIAQTTSRAGSAHFAWQHHGILWRCVLTSRAAWSAQLVPACMHGTQRKLFKHQTSARSEMT